jgi:hypothetical protein
MSVVCIYVDLDEESRKPHAQPYDPAVHLWNSSKFLFWSDIGFKPFLIIGSPKIYSHIGLQTRWDEMEPSHEATNRYPAGAGELSSGRVSLWNSRRPEVETPDEFRPLIVAALGVSSEE